MIPVIYLLTGFVLFMAIGELMLLRAIHKAVDGFEDRFGFHFS